MPWRHNYRVWKTAGAVNFVLPSLECRPLNAIVFGRLRIKIIIIILIAIIGNTPGHKDGLTGSSPLYTTRPDVRIRSENHANLTRETWNITVNLARLSGPVRSTVCTALLSGKQRSSKSTIPTSSFSYSPSIPHSPRVGTPFRISIPIGQRAQRHAM